MVEFRQNYNRQGRGPAGLIRQILLVAVLAAIIVLMLLMYITPTSSGGPGVPKTDVQSTLAVSSTGNVLAREGFTISYAEAYEQPEWIAYVIRKSSDTCRISLGHALVVDPDIDTESAIPADYEGTRYRPIPLVNHGLICQNSASDKDLELLSNSSPMDSVFTTGSWKRSVKMIQRVSSFMDSMLVISGPVFAVDPIDTIGESRIIVPGAFFHAVAGYRDEQIAGAGLLVYVPGSVADGHGVKIVTIDSLEKLTQIEMFGGLPEEEKIESATDTTLWY